MDINLKWYSFVHACILLFEIVFGFVIFLVCINLIPLAKGNSISKDDFVVPMIIFSIAVLVFVVSLITGKLLLNQKRHKLCVYEDNFYINGKRYLINDIYAATYSMPKWYSVFLPFLIKGRDDAKLKVVMNNGDTFEFYLFYKEFKMFNLNIPCEIS